MKKLSLVMAAAMCMTVGGVYATWSYATGAISEPASASKFVNLSNLGSATEKGEITVAMADVTLMIDQDTSASVSHTAKLVITNSPVVTFTPAVGASVDAIEMTITISESYESYTKLDGTTKVDLFTVLDGVGNPSTNGTSFSFDIPAEDNDASVAGQQYTIDLAKYIRLNNLVLEDLEEYNAFKAWLGSCGGEILITVSEKVVTNS